MVEKVLFDRQHFHALGEVFNKVKLGVLVLRKTGHTILFANQFFTHVAHGFEDEIIEAIFNDLNILDKPDFRSDLELGKDKHLVVGYTIYRLSETDALVFLSDISYKRIYFENKDENRFYDRLSHLIAEVVHEVGNPLTSINTTLQVLLQYLDQWDSLRQREYIDQTIAEIDRLVNYLNKMRHFSRIVSSECSSVRLKPILDRVFTYHRELVRQKKISVTVSVDETLHVMIDEDLFYQVLLNLFINSMDILAEQGKISLQVEDVNEYYVKLVYRNDGPPIPEEIKQKIFIPFFSTKQQGRGIGLAVSLKLMTRMGGALKVEPPELGWGAKFVLYVPVGGQPQFHYRQDSFNQM